MFYSADPRAVPEDKPTTPGAGPRGLLERPSHLFCFAVVMLSAVYFVIHASMYYSGLDFESRNLGRSDLADFFAFYSSARLLWEGGAPWELYDGAILKAFQMSLGAGQEGLHPFNYPPTYLLIIWPFGGLTYPVALIVWQLVTLALFVLALRTAGLRPFEILAAVVAPVTILNFSGGQNGCLTSALLIGGLALLSRRQAVAGGLFGLLTVKPHLGLLVPLVCLAERRWLAIASAATVTGLLIAVTVVLFGAGIWQAYLDFLVGFQAQVQDQAAGAFLDYSATVLMAGQILGVPKALAAGLQIAVSLGVALAVWWAWRRPTDGDLRLALLLIGVSLATPFGFLYDLPFMAVAIVLVARLALRDGFMPYEILCLATVWMMPFFGNLAAARGIPLAALAHLIFFGFVLMRMRRAA
ncbi:MAG: glycosyltransferase family 87 protein [Pseudomonadota bacterium]